MHVAEQEVPGHRIYAAALVAEDCSPAGLGFHAAVVVVRLNSGSTDREEVFRDERLDDGKTWTNPELALQFALEVGEAAIRAQAWLAEQLLAQEVSRAAASRRSA
jgi:hypothetical protein